MRTRLACIRLVFSALLLTTAARAAAAPRDYAYISPPPNGERVSPGNNIALRPGAPIDPASLHAGLVNVTGERSGRHDGRLSLSTDGRTILWKPELPFALSERVHVQVGAGARTLSGRTLPALAYSFTVSAVDPRSLPPPPDDEFLKPRDPGLRWPGTEAPAATTVLPCDTLLPGFPTISVVNRNQPHPGVFFMAPFATANQSTANLQILDDFGKPLYQRVFQANFLPVDFKLQRDGRLTFWMNGAYKYYAMDSAYAFVDSFVCGNGYPTDLHELNILPNGHALMMSYDPQIVGMDTVVAGGNPNATVYGLIVQELDLNKDVVFQWRSWDHFKITDGSVSPLSTLTGASVDYVHANSIDMGPDGNLVVSCRHMNELTKIDRQTGDVIWRMGLHAANNQWTFPNDSRGFSHTHDARIQPNGNLTVYDNGNFLVPQYSRAVEYQLDEVNKVATLVWEYRHAPDIYGGFMGNVQRHADGSTTIGWGGPFNTLLKAVDLHADGSIAAELEFPSTDVNYRTFRTPWRSNRILTDVQAVAIETPAAGLTASRTLKVWNHWDRPIDLTCLRTAHPTFGATLASGTLPMTLAPGDTTTVQIVYAPEDSNEAHSRLYIMQVSEGEIVAQTVDLQGNVAGTVSVNPSAGTRLAAVVRPNPVLGRATFEILLPAPGPVTLEIYDVHGRHVSTPLRERLGAGSHRVDWNAGAQRPGLYFSRCTAAGQTVVRKFVVGG